MSEAYIDGGSIPYPGYVNAAPEFQSIFLTSAAVPTGVGIYVSESGGSDANPGTLNDPFATLGRALSARASFSTASYVTIFLLPSNYTAAGDYAIPSNTAIVGVQAGGFTDYLNGSQVSLGGSPVTLVNYNLALGSALPATGGRVLLSGLNIQGSVSPQYAEPTYYMYNCTVQNNTLAGPIPGTALYTTATTRMYIEACTFTSNSAVNSVVFIQSEEFSILNSTIKMTNVNPPVAPSAPVIGHSYATTTSGFQSFIVSNCEFSTAFGFALNNAPILQFLTSTSGIRTIAEITDSSLRYDATVVSTNPLQKVCIRNEGSRIIELTVANCLLLQPGGAPDSIRSVGQMTLTYGNNLGVNGKNAQAVQTAIALQTMA